MPRTATKSRKVIEFTIPIGVVSEANQREHWGKKLRRKILQQKTTLFAAYVYRDEFDLSKLSGPLRITLTRRAGLDGMGRRNTRMMDVDNLAGSFKHVADALCKVIGRDDGDPTIRWEYDQEQSERREVAVRIEVG